MYDDPMQAKHMLFHGLSDIAESVLVQEGKTASSR